MKNLMLKKGLLIGFLTVLCCFSFAGISSADTKASTGTNSSTSVKIEDNLKDATKLQEKATSTANSFVGAVRGLAGVATVVFMIIAGIFFFTANGNQEKLEKAKSMIKYIVLGIVLFFYADSITGTVLSWFNG